MQSFTQELSSAPVCLPGWGYSPKLQTSFHLNCKRRRCDDCGKFWAWKWRQALAEKQAFDRTFDIKSCSRALTLTFACNPGYEKVQRALEYFWRFVRKRYPRIEYFGALEFNQKHTVPHVHFILANDVFMEWEWLVPTWQKAQRWAGIETVAFNVRIERIRKNAQAYYTKYISKLTGGKDEIPRRENWQGRFIRYSRKFFPAPIPAMAVAAKFKRQMEAGENLDRLYFLARAPYQSLEEWKTACDREADRLNWLVNRPWDYLADRQKSDLATAPPPDLFSFLEPELFHVKQPTRQEIDLFAERIKNCPRCVLTAQRYAGKMI